MQKHVNLVDLVKSFPTNIFLQNLASVQQRTSLMKFDHLGGNSEEGSILNLSTKFVARRFAVVVFAVVVFVVVVFAVVVFAVVVFVIARWKDREKSTQALNQNGYRIE